MVIHEAYWTQHADGVKRIWHLPEEVERREDGTASLISDGTPVNIDPPLKMSKSKKNVVDPDDIVATKGADTARWLMLSDSPPERDVEWTIAGVEGASRFLHRVWRLFDEAVTRLAPLDSPDVDCVASALELRRTTHKTIVGVTADIEGFAFNKAIARLHEFANALGRVSDADTGAAFARREAFEVFARLANPMIPHFAEEMWEALGHQTPLVDTDWPVANPALTEDDSIVLPVQVNGKRRGEIKVARDAANGDIEAAALAEEGVARFLEGRNPRKVIVVPGRIVNVVL